MVASVVSLRVGDEPDAWRAAGFNVRDDETVIGSVRIRFDRSGGGITAWSLFHPDEQPGARSLDGLTTELVDELPEVVATTHPNTAVGLDHIVISTPDIDRTTAAFGSLGVVARRTRDTTAADAPLRQRFFRMGTIIEVIGPPEPGPRDGAARFWGLALVAPDLDAVAAVLGPRLGRIKDAVQPGRRIATVRTDDLGIGVPIAFMTPHRR